MPKTMPPIACEVAVLSLRMRPAANTLFQRDTQVTPLVYANVLRFEAAVQRDYPVIFGTLYVFGLMGLLVGILSDLTYVLVDPRIDFESRAG